MDSVDDRVVELWCGVYGEGSVFPIQIAPTATVSELQNVIFDKKRYRELYTFDASAMVLYLTKQEDGVRLNDDDRVKAILQRGRQDDAGHERMIPNRKLNKDDYFGSNSSHDPKRIHVLVELPTLRSAGVINGAAGSAKSLSSWSVRDVDTTSKWLRSYHASRLTDHDLPQLHGLAAFIKEPHLTKIAIVPSTLAAIPRERDGGELRDVLERLFVDEHSQFVCKKFTDRVVHFIVYCEIGDGTGTEASFHYLWDTVIRLPLTVVFPNGIANRGSRAGNNISI